MDEDPAGGVRRKKDSSLVRVAELVRDGKASAMVSAGNTGATMAAALLRMGRLPGVIRPCIATPLPRLGRTPAVLVDAGANAECTPAMLVQFAQMGAAYVAARFGTDLADGRPALHRRGVDQGHAAGQRDPCPPGRQAGTGFAFEFVGNLEGRDLLPSPADVIVTDGFTGNVALKALEGSLRFLFDAMLGVFCHERRDQGGGRRPAAATCCRWRPSSSRRTPAGPCCWAPTASASSATGRRTRSPCSTRCGWPTSAPPGVWRTMWRPPSARPRRGKNPVQRA